MGRKLDKQLKRLESRRARYDALDPRDKLRNRRPGSMNPKKGTGEKGKR